MLRFIHAADIHLDSPLRGLDQYAGCPAATIRNAARRAFENLVQLAITEKVAFVLLAGDIYDGDWKDYRTGLFFVEQLKKLRDAGIPVVLLFGNHDAQSKITKQLTLPVNTVVLSVNEAQTLSLLDGAVVIHGQGFAKQAELRNLAENYPAAVKGSFNIGMLHTSLTGSSIHGNYAPCTRNDLLNRGYDYWALGHIHLRQSVNGSEKVRIEFPGNIQGRHIGETGAKGCLLVEVDSRGVATPEFRALDVFRWVEVTVAADQAESFDDIGEAADTALREAVANAEGRPVGARLTIHASEALCRMLIEDPDRLRSDLIARGDSEVWIEKVKLKPRSESNVAEEGLGDAASELRAVLAEMVTDEQVMQALRDEVLRAGKSEGATIFANDRDEIVQRAALLLTGSGGSS